MRILREWSAVQERALQTAILNARIDSTRA
jgi:hypothetical protein